MSDQETGFEDIKLQDRPCQSISRNWKGVSPPGLRGRAGWEGGIQNQSQHRCKQESHQQPVFAGWISGAKGIT